MPKTKKQKLTRNDGPPAKRGRKMHAFSRVSTSTSTSKPGPVPGNSKPNKQNQNQQQQQRKPIIPFHRSDRILLIGEGDFSFSRSLVTQHKCHKILATCYDDAETVRMKYPRTAEVNIHALLNPSSSSSGTSERDAESQAQREKKGTSGPGVLYSVDARKLGSAGGGGKDVRGGHGFERGSKKQDIPAWKQAQQQKKKNEPHQPREGRKEGPWDVICFNFPHVGGLSTDVNRQVRANQELLVGFFKACVPLLSLPVEDDSDEGSEEDEDEYDYGSDDPEGNGRDANGAPRTQPGQILVTLFEAEPYTLWNIRDLARHAGLRVVTSFRFPWASYEGYSHARTLGDVEGKQGGRGGWRGEDREARMYVFEHAQAPSRPQGKKKNKRGRDDSDSDSD